MARQAQQVGIRSAVTLLLTGCFILSVKAQNGEEEYQMDLGASLGTSFYLGDVNSTPYAHMGGMGGIIAHRIFNPRMAIKANLCIGYISGTSDGYFIPTDARSKTPEGGIPTTVSFSRNLLDLGAQFELNFWGFGMGTGYKENSRITPYALMGSGLTAALGGTGTNWALNLPIGAGVKYKISHRMNVGLEWTIRFTTCDALDASNKDQTLLIHPMGIDSEGFKNKDCYSFTMVFITYEMCPKRRKCNNE